MLSACISSWHARSLHASVPYTHAQHFWRDFLKFGIFTLLLSIRLRNWRVCSKYASIPDAYAQQTYQFLNHMLRVHISSWCIFSACFEGTVFSALISPWRVCSAHAPAPDSYAQHTHHFLTPMLGIQISSWHACSVQVWVPYMHAECIQNEHLKKGKTDAYGQGVHKFLRRSLSAHISSWPVCLAWAYKVGAWT